MHYSEKSVSIPTLKPPQQVVNSPQHDLFLPLPAEFDYAIQDRFAAYIPGWEMPKNSSEFLTSRYGFITDYLAEAFHYQFKHTNRYEEVSKRIRLGKSIEGRDEKGIKKTVCAFLKILHPSGTPTDEEFEEYVAYATECRRRVKEQIALKMSPSRRWIGRISLCQSRQHSRMWIGKRHIENSGQQVKAKAREKLSSELSARSVWEAAEAEIVHAADALSFRKN